MLHLPNKSYHAIRMFLEENKNMIYWYMVLSISRAIRNKNHQAELFSFGFQNENIAMIKENTYENILIDAIGIFSQVEEYEHAAFARDVLQKWKIEQIINEKPME